MKLPCQKGTMRELRRRAEDLREELFWVEREIEERDRRASENYARLQLRKAEKQSPGLTKLLEREWMQ